MSVSAPLPHWALSLLVCPDSHEALQLVDNGFVRLSDGAAVATLSGGIVHFDVSQGDPSIEYYRAIGGASFTERSAVPFAMSSLDTPIYHSYLEELRPASYDDVIVDVGGGDGRNARPWLEWGYRRVVVIDPVADGLQRLRDRIAAACPAWLDHVLLVAASARRLPIASAAASRVLAIEALAYLNEAYREGLAQCARLLNRHGRLLLSDRDTEMSLIVRLLYGGLDEMLTQAGGAFALDGAGGQLVRSRVFTADELADEVRAVGLRVVETKGISGLSVILGYLNNQDRLGTSTPVPTELLASAQTLLARLGRRGSLRRAHVLVAARSDDFASSPE